MEWFLSHAGPLDFLIKRTGSLFAVFSLFLKLHWCVSITWIRTYLSLVLLEEESDLPSWRLSVAENQKEKSFAFYILPRFLTVCLLWDFCQAKQSDLPRCFTGPCMKSCHFPNPVNISKHLRRTPDLGPNSMLLKNFEKLFWKEGVKLEMQDYIVLDKVPEKWRKTRYFVSVPSLVCVMQQIGISSVGRFWHDIYQWGTISLNSKEIAS